MKSNKLTKLLFSVMHLKKNCLTCSLSLLMVSFMSSSAFAQLSATITGVDVKCKGDSSGYATVNATGGTLPYSYSWSLGGVTGAIAPGLAAGNYICTITDSSTPTPQTITKSITINEPTASKITASTSQTNGDCSGGTGTATVVASGGTGGYTYLWSPSGQTGATANGLVGGTYTCSITDAGNGCSINESFTITDHLTPPTVITKDITITLDTSGNGTISVAQINNGSSANCGGIASMVLDRTIFSCADLPDETSTSADVTVTLTVTDGNGNSASSPANVTILFSAICYTAVTINTETTLDGPSQTMTVPGKLILNANLHLKNGAQLIQTHAGKSINVVNNQAVLTFDQTGTVDKYGYNYWCSPVGDGSSSNLFGIGLFFDPATGNPAATVNAPNYDGAPSPLTIATYWINTFKSAGTYNDWHNEGAGTTIPPGYGFSMKGTTTPPTTGQQYEFRGTPNDGDIVTAVAVKPAGADPVADPAAGYFTLIGNPYPSAVDLKAFFGDDENRDTDQVAYYWEQGPTTLPAYSPTSHNIAKYVGGYGIYGPFGLEGGVTYVPATFFNFDGYGNYVACSTCPANPGNPDRGFVPIGQGFMVKGDIYYNESVDGGPVDATHPWLGDGRVIMKNAYRVSGAGGTFSRKTAQNKLPQIRFNTTYDNGAIGQMVQMFAEESTQGIDKGKDVLNPNYYPSQVNFLVDDQRCVISTMPFNVDKKIPLIFDNQAQASYKITVNEIVNLDQVSNVYLHDIVADQYHDIKNNFYEFTLPAGMNYEQYEITFKDNSLGLNDVKVEKFDIFQDNSAKKLIVSNPMQMELVACDLYDIAGRMIFSKKQLGTQPSYEFSTAELTDGIYIVRVTSQENKTKAQKIIVRR